MAVYYRYCSHPIKCLLATNWKDYMPWWLQLQCATAVTVSVCNIAIATFTHVALMDGDFKESLSYNSSIHNGI